MRDILYGIAVADAIGNPLEFLSNPTHDDFVQSIAQPVLRVSDDTQMTLFLAEALATGKTSKDAYLRWYRTQTGKPAKLGGLLDFPELYSREAPGATCMASCHALSLGQSVQNNSKGNGTVMRCAPIALLGWEYGWTTLHTLDVAIADAVVTHRHPLAAQSSALLTAIYLNLFAGQPFSQAVRMAIDEADQLDSLLGSLVTAAMDKSRFPSLRESLGGWVAEEAVALAVGAVAHADNYLNIVENACCIPGDSDTVAAIAGGLAVATGMPVPHDLQIKINIRGPIEYVRSIGRGIIPEGL